LNKKTLTLNKSKASDLLIGITMNDEKISDAEEIFSEFQKKNIVQEKQSESKTTPEPQLSGPEPEPILPKSEPQKELPEESFKKESDNTDEDDTERIRNVIFVGIKPIMTYVTATLTQLSSQPTVTIKARGKRITQAVDVSQMIVKRMDSVGYKVTDVRIASDSLTSQDGRQRNVSTIEIDVTKT
jgi:DNA-binding protein